MRLFPDSCKFWRLQIHNTFFFVIANLGNDIWTGRQWVGVCVCVLKSLGNLHIDTLYNKYRQTHSYTIKPPFY